MSIWKVGSKVKLNVYKDDRPICQCHSKEDAGELVAGMNAQEAQKKPSAAVSKPLVGAARRKVLRMMMPVAKPARPAKKPNAAQLRVLARMIQERATIRVSTWAVTIGRRNGIRTKISRSSYDAMRVAGWIEISREGPDAWMASEWRVSEAGRKAAR